MDTNSTAQMCIFIRGVTSDFEVFEEIRVPFNARSYKGVGLHSGTTLQKHNLQPPKLVGIVTDGAPSMIGSKNCILSSSLYANTRIRSS